MMPSRLRGARAVNTVSWSQGTFNIQHPRYILFQETIRLSDILRNGPHIKMYPALALYRGISFIQYVPRHTADSVQCTEIFRKPQSQKGLVQKVWGKKSQIWAPNGRFCTKNRSSHAVAAELYERRRSYTRCHTQKPGTN
jgi:hypothetical protein